eukprot:TRINITY_DN13698_c0_g1_i1.p1 TRINITY_DN13698_c0_g1~~TRINITY_DN13698_c0_g1_i1.p1  ORF type:complete len:788 (-),score=199.03 TRINITY_DN13698_c0_g1_i1:157-2520(-)
MATVGPLGEYILQVEEACRRVSEHAKTSSKGLDQWIAQAFANPALGLPQMPQEPFVAGLPPCVDRHSLLKGPIGKLREHIQEDVQRHGGRVGGVTALSPNKQPRSPGAPPGWQQHAKQVSAGKKPYSADLGRAAPCGVPSPCRAGAGWQSQQQQPVVVPPQSPPRQRETTPSHPAAPVAFPTAPSLFSQPSNMDHTTEFSPPVTPVPAAGGITSWPSLPVQPLLSVPVMSAAVATAPSLPSAAARTGLRAESPSPHAGLLDQEKEEKGNMVKRIEAPEKSGTPVPVSERVKLFETQRAGGNTPSKLSASKAAPPSATFSPMVVRQASAPPGSVAGCASGQAAVIDGKSMFTPISSVQTSGVVGTVRKELFRTQDPAAPAKSSTALPAAAHAPPPGLAMPDASGTASVATQLVPPAPLCGTAPAGAHMAPMSTESCERLAAGGRRDDFEKPKSLRAAEHAKEQAKLQEERRLREKQERERLKAAKEGVASSGSAKDLMKVTAEPLPTLPVAAQPVATQPVATQEAAPKPRESPSAVSTMASVGASSVPSVASSAQLPLETETKAELETKPVGKKVHRRSAVMMSDVPEPAPEAATSAASAPVLPVQSRDEAAVESMAGRGGSSSSSSSAATFGIERDTVPPKQPKEPEPWQILRQQVLPPSRPEDNYEISEKGGDSDAEDNEDLRARKPVPAWCESFLQQLKSQEDVDPDTIFGPRVPPCVLEDIFSDELYVAVGKKRPKRARGSSGDWNKDRLQRDDVDKYKSRMGHVRSWTEAEAAAHGSATPAAR